MGSSVPADLAESHLGAVTAMAQARWFDGLAKAGIALALPIKIVSLTIGLWSPLG
jgi:hypothetical protein